MAKITVRNIDTTARGPLPPGIDGDGAVARPVFAGADDPIHLHGFDLAAGGHLRWPAGRQGRVVYVRRGAVAVGGVAVGAGGSVTIEHGAAVRIDAVEPSALIAFTAMADGGDLRRGGHVHILPPEDVPRCTLFGGSGHVGGALFADAACPTCELWLHETIVHPGGQGTPVHSHSEDEVIVVLAGEIVLGRKAHGPGTAIAIARDTLYGFDNGPEGLLFINFRPRSPVYVPRDRTRGPIDERAYYLAHMPPPQPRTIAAAPA